MVDIVLLVCPAIHICSSGCGQTFLQKILLLISGKPGNSGSKKQVCFLGSHVVWGQDGGVDGGA